MSKPCRFFLQGFCRNGNNCQFDHQEVVTERDGNMGRTFVNTDKYEYRRKTDVRQRIDSRNDQRDGGTRRKTDKGEEEEGHITNRNIKERSNESKEERNEWGRERSFKDRMVDERRRTEGGEGAYNKNSRERLIQLG